MHLPKTLAYGCNFSSVDSTSKTQRQQIGLFSVQLEHHFVSSLARAKVTENTRFFFISFAHGRKNIDAAISSGDVASSSITNTFAIFFSHDLRATQQAVCTFFP